MAKSSANIHGIKPRPVTEAEKAALGPHVLEYANAQKQVEASQASVQFLVEKFVGKGLVLDIRDNEWSFVPAPPTARPQIVEPAPED